MAATSGAHVRAKQAPAVVTMCGRNCFLLFIHLRVLVVSRSRRVCTSNRMQRAHCMVTGFIALVLVRGALSASPQPAEEVCVQAAAIASAHSVPYTRNPHRQARSAGPLMATAPSTMPVPCTSRLRPRVEGWPLHGVRHAARPPPGLVQLALALHQPRHFVWLGWRGALWRVHHVRPLGTRKY